jgi:hypothetical protein
VSNAGALGKTVASSKGLPRLAGCPCTVVFRVFIEPLMTKTNTTYDVATDRRVVGKLEHTAYRWLRGEILI